VVGDTITSVDGLPVATVDDLRSIVMAHAPGDVITLGVMHADQSKADVAVTLGTAPSM
jgi:S1-C subfamily serine protease